MRKPQPVALAATGKLMQSFLLDLPGFQERIGPVKAPTQRVGTRLVNGLRTGIAVADFQEFDGCAVVFICVPDEMLGKVVGELAEAPLDWAGRTAVVCDSRLTSAALKPLASCGAFTASLELAAGSSRLLLVDGHRRAIAALKPVFGRRVRIVRIPPELKDRYYRGLEIASLGGPLAALADEELRSIGLTPSQARPVIEAVLLEAVRDYMKSGRKLLANSANARIAEMLRSMVQSALG